MTTARHVASTNPDLLAHWCGWCDSPLSEADRVLAAAGAKVSTGMCAVCEAAYTRDLAGREPDSLPNRSRSLVADVMRVTYRRLRRHDATRMVARSTARRVRNVATMVAIHRELEG